MEEAEFETEQQLVNFDHYFLPKIQYDQLQDKFRLVLEFQYSARLNLLSMTLF